MIGHFDNRYRLSAGVDEVGRGPLAGPVIAAAVILDRDNPVAGLKDSKKLSHQRRLALSAQIKSKAFAWSIARAEIEEIERLNILGASLLAMKRAVETLSIRPDRVFVDGLHKPDVKYPVEAIVGGDSMISEISAASIIAKVARDAEMVNMDKDYPGYHFAANKGYPTAQHLESLQRHGITKIHRRSFSPVRKILNQRG